MNCIKEPFIVNKSTVSDNGTAIYKFISCDNETVICMLEITKEKEEECKITINVEPKEYTFTSTTDEREVNVIIKDNGHCKNSEWQYSTDNKASWKDGSGNSITFKNFWKSCDEADINPRSTKKIYFKAKADGSEVTTVFTNCQKEKPPLEDITLYVEKVIFNSAQSSNEITWKSNKPIKDELTLENMYWMSGDNIEQNSSNTDSSKIKLAKGSSQGTVKLPNNVLKARTVQYRFNNDSIKGGKNANYIFKETHHPEKLIGGESQKAYTFTAPLIKTIQFHEPMQGRDNITITYTSHPSVNVRYGTPISLALDKTNEFTIGIKESSSTGGQGHQELLGFLITLPSEDRNAYEILSEGDTTNFNDDKGGNFMIYSPSYGNSYKLVIRSINCANDIIINVNYGNIL